MDDLNHVGMTDRPVSFDGFMYYRGIQFRKHRGIQRIISREYLIQNKIKIPMHKAVSGGNILIRIGGEKKKALMIDDRVRKRSTPPILGPWKRSPGLNPNPSQQPPPDIL